MIRIFIGADGGNCDLESQMVLDYTIRKYASEPVDITWMQQANKGPFSGWNMKSARTPFTHYRWAPPAVCNYEGRAIYMDVDFIVRADIAELWHQPIPNVMLLKDCTGKLSTSCILFDCAKSKGHVPDLDRMRRMPDANGDVTKYFREHKELVSMFSGAWNCIDGGGFKDVNDPAIKAIHYSRIETQPQLRYALPRLKKEGKAHWYTGEVRTHWRQDLLDLFDAEYRAAMAAGCSIEDYRVVNGVVAQRKNFAYKHHMGAA